MNDAFQHRIRFHAPLRGIRSDETAGTATHSVAIGTQETAPKNTPTQEELDWNALNELLLEAGQRVTESLDRNRHSLQELQELAIKLAVAIAGRVLREKISTGDFPFENLIQDVLARLAHEGRVTVHLNPKDEAMLRERLAGKQARWPREIEFVGDPSLERGSCRADSEQFGIIAKLEWQLSEIQQTLLQSLEDAQIERRTTQPNDRGLRRHPDRRETA